MLRLCVCAFVRSFFGSERVCCGLEGGLAGEHIISFVPLVNKSCFGFVYQHCLMSKDAPDSVFVCLFVSARERRATAIGISADARKQQQHRKALEAKKTAHVSEQDVLVGLALALCFVSF